MSFDRLTLDKGTGRRCGNRPPVLVVEDRVVVREIAQLLKAFCWSVATLAGALSAYLPGLLIYSDGVPYCPVESRRGSPCCAWS